MANAATEERRPFGGVSKDPLDLRDLMYESSLRELPFELDNRTRVPIVLDQGREGACTGFGLAAVVNFLRYNRADADQTVNRKLGRREGSASPRMLYEMAKRYDEWEGENYEGSSIRGAMKGWLRHGVCDWSDWPYDENQPGRLTPPRQLKALGTPLGAYLRVRHLYLNNMHAALNEAGILYASAQVHEGWYDVDPNTGRIPYNSRKAGGHAFAIVGYDAAGFWIQNSWGPDWGHKGFCHIAYDDWLENAFDCWVARLGVPTSSLAVQGDAERSRVSEFDHIPHESVVLSAIRPHFVNVGNDGRFSDTGIYASGPEDVTEIVLGGFKAKAAEWGGTPKLLLYAHGGLNNEKASASRIATLQPYFMANQIYPVHFMWESGLGDSLRGIVEDALRRGRFTGWTDTLKERFYDLVDEGIELAARGVGRPVWAQMKDNARRASADDAGGAAFTARAMADLFGAVHPPPELHLVGHSAGGIFLGHLVPCLVDLGLGIRTLTLYAPACTTELFKQNVMPHVGNAIGRLTIFNLSAAAELDDTVTSAYHKSLLCLVSEALEARRKTPLLGMESFLTEDRAIKRKLGAAAFKGGTAVAYSVGGAKSIKIESKSATHGGFDNDEDTLNSTMRIIRGRNGLDRSF